MKGTAYRVTAMTIAIGVLGTLGNVMRALGRGDNHTLGAEPGESLGRGAPTRTGRNHTIYSSAGITVRWRDRLEMSTQRHFIVNITTKPLNGRGEISSSGVMGMAPGLKEAHGMHAWAFYATIQAFAALHGIDAGSLLGYVIAHEVGHRLLRDNSHSQQDSCAPDGTNCR